MKSKTRNSIPEPTSNDVEEKVSAVVWFKGKCLTHTSNLQGDYYKKYHKHLTKSDAINKLFEQIPDKALKEATEKALSDTK